MKDFVYPAKISKQHLVKTRIAYKEKVRRKPFFCEDKEDGEKKNVDKQTQFKCSNIYAFIYTCIYYIFVWMYFSVCVCDNVFRWNPDYNFKREKFLFELRATHSIHIVRTDEKNEYEYISILKTEKYRKISLAFAHKWWFFACKIKQTENVKVYWVGSSTSKFEWIFFILVNSFYLLIPPSTMIFTQVITSTLHFNMRRFFLFILPRKNLWYFKLRSTKWINMVYEHFDYREENQIGYEDDFHYMIVGIMCNL